MSLRVWLPLTQNLDNKGASNVEIINSGATISAPGKIGSCYYFNGSTYLHENNYNWTNFNTSTFSFCCWYKEPSPVASGNSQIICIGTNSGWPNIRIGLLRRVSNGYPMFSVSDGTNSVAYNCTSTTFSLDVWNHIACTYKDGVISIYLNGTLNTTYTTTIVPVLNSSQHLGIGAASNGAEKLTGYLNDVRIYDHCLSPLEVKEISQGLILHYKLDGPMGGANPNLLNGTLQNRAFISTRNSRKSGQFENLSGGNGTVSIIADNTVPIGKYAFSIQNNTSGNKDFAQYCGDMLFALKEGNQYTISAYYKGTGTSLMRIWDYTTNTQLLAKTQAVPSDVQWNRLSYTFTATAAMNTNNIGVLIGISGAGSVVMCGFKFEEGGQATEYCCSAWDLGIDETVIEDSSGYNNNGTAKNITTTADAARYNCATAFDGTGFITRAALNADIYTMTCWAKTSKNKNTAQMIVADRASAMCITFYANSIVSFFGAQADAGTGSRSTLGSEYKENDWNFFAVVKTDEKGGRDVYCNGVKLTPVANNYYSATCIFGIGNRSDGGNTPFYGAINDVRCYATPLLDSDIKMLYNMGMRVDNLGGIHSFEYAEKSSAGALNIGRALTPTYNVSADTYSYTLNAATSNQIVYCPAELRAVANHSIEVGWGERFIHVAEMKVSKNCTISIDYNNGSIDSSITLSGNDNDTGRYAASASLIADQWVPVVFSYANTNESKNPSHVALYDYSTIYFGAHNDTFTLEVRKPHSYVIKATENLSINQTGVVEYNNFTETEIRSYASVRDNEKSLTGTNIIEI